MSSSHLKDVMNFCSIRLVLQIYGKKVKSEFDTRLVILPCIDIWHTKSEEISGCAVGVALVRPTARLGEP